jgi:hypothetical protein
MTSRLVAMLDQLPRDAAEQARAVAGNPVRADHDHGHAELPGDVDQRVGRVDLVGNGAWLRGKPERASQLGAVGGDRRGVLALDAIDRLDGV